MNSRPNIELDRSLSLNDHFAGHIVDQTMKALAHDISGLFTSDIPDSRGLGNPKGQLRWFKQLVASLEPSVLTAAIKTGKGMRFEAMIDIWAIHPQNPGILSTGRLHFKGDGPRRRMITGLSSMCSLSRHALLRAVQRTGFTKPEDLTRLLFSAWNTIQLALLAVQGKDDLLPGWETQGWLLPASTPDGKEVFFVAKRGTAREDRMIIVSILDEGMIRNPAALERLRAFIEIGTADRGQAFLDENHGLLLDALRETPNALWRA